MTLVTEGIEQHVQFCNFILYRSMLILAFSLAIIIGILLGLFGGGGSIFTVPVLVYVMQYEVEESTMFSLLVVGIASAIGSAQYARSRNISFKHVSLMGLGGIAGVLITRFWLLPALPNVLLQSDSFKLTKSTALMVLFALIMAASAYTMLRKKKASTSNETKVEVSRSSWLMLLAGFVVGILTGLIGVGGGFLIIPVLTALYHLPMKRAVGTSLFIITINSLVGLSAGTDVEVPWNFLLPFAAFTVVGMFIGIQISKRYSSERLRPAFGWFVLVTAVYIFTQEIFIS